MRQSLVQDSYQLVRAALHVNRVVFQGVALEAIIFSPLPDLKRVSATPLMANEGQLQGVYPPAPFFVLLAPSLEHICVGLLP